MPTSRAPARPTTPRTAGARPASRRRGPGWVPREHGAWAMLVVPVLVGGVLTSPTWRTALLLVTWLTAYLAFHATGLWLRASRRPRYLPPVRAYATALVLLGGTLLATAPGLLRWAPVYGALLATSLVCSLRRADRSWLNDGVTVGAAVLMTVVSAGLGHDGTPPATALTGTWVPPGADDPAAWAVTAVLAGYFFGTVPYVKTLLRERGNRAVLSVSVAWHALLVVAAVAVLAVQVTHERAAGSIAVAVALVVAAAGLLARAVLVPRRRPWPSPRAIGFGEIAATLAVTAAALAVPALAAPSLVG
ncbi:YwiC-like family protein [Cellulomonas uda]|nr:YwiC-like family protein [Cellulomonas uda]NII67718.1 hypothetical protein [Cellulomonas uda]